MGAGAEGFLQQVILFMTAVALLAGVPLAVATVVGLIISFFQAVTQIQDQTLAQTVKIAAIALTFMVMGGTLMAPLVEASISVFDTFWIPR